MQHTINLPEWATTLGDLGDTLRSDGDHPLNELGEQLLDLIDDHKRMADEEEEVRLVLIGFGVLEDGDTTTDRAALLAMLLPASKA